MGLVVLIVSMMVKICDRGVRSGLYNSDDIVASEDFVMTLAHVLER
jgi:hypothetical protein